MGLARLDPWKLGLRSLSASGGPVTLGVSVDEGVIRGLGNATLTSARYAETEINFLTICWVMLMIFFPRLALLTKVGNNPYNGTQIHLQFYFLE